MATGRGGYRVRADSRRALEGREATPGNVMTSVMAPGSRTAPPSSRAGNREQAPDVPVRWPAGSARHDGPGPGGSPLPCGASGKSAWWSAGHARGQADVGERQGRVFSHPVSRGMPQRMQGRRFPPLPVPARTSGARHGRSAAGPAGAASTTVAAAAPRESAPPSPPDRAAATRTRRWKPGSSCSSRVPFRTTVIICRPGSTPASVADSNSDARAPVDT